MPYGNRNCWDCPHCEQYNGFQEVRPGPRLLSHPVPSRALTAAQALRLSSEDEEISPGNKAEVGRLGFGPGFAAYALCFAPDQGPAGSLQRAREHFRLCRPHGLCAHSLALPSHHTNKHVWLGSRKTRSTVAGPCLRAPVPCCGSRLRSRWELPSRQLAYRASCQSSCDRRASGVCCMERKGGTA